MGETVSTEREEVDSRGRGKTGELSGRGGCWSAEIAAANVPPFDEPRTGLVPKLLARRKNALAPLVPPFFGVGLALSGTGEEASVGVEGEGELQSRSRKGRRVSTLSSAAIRPAWRFKGCRRRARDAPCARTGLSTAFELAPPPKPKEILRRPSGAPSLSLLLPPPNPKPMKLFLRSRPRLCCCNGRCGISGSTKPRDVVLPRFPSGRSDASASRSTSSPCMPDGLAGRPGEASPSPA